MPPPPEHSGPFSVPLSANHSCSTPLDFSNNNVLRWLWSLLFLLAEADGWFFVFFCSCLWFLCVSSVCWIKGCSLVSPLLTKHWWDAVVGTVCWSHAGCYGDCLGFKAPLIRSSALILHSELSPVSTIFQHFVIWHMCSHICFFFSLEKKKRCQPLFLSISLLGTHAPCIGCVVSPIQDSCTGWLSLRSPLCPHMRPMHPHTLRP